MVRRYRLFVGIAAAIGLFSIFLGRSGAHFEVLHTYGEIGDRQRSLLYFTVALSLFVIIPVFTLTYYIVNKYRADNPKARYTPDWDGNNRLEFIWWSFPLTLIVILAVVTWVTSHSLDPRKAIASDVPPVKIQVVALQWKWLFIYPDSNVATLNYVKIPENRPVEFDITADAPMNSFSIPQLGGQVYAMTGMSNKLNLIAHETGTFRGQSANLSGEGFADMHFDAISVNEQEYNSWLSEASMRSSKIDYDTVRVPSKPNGYQTFSTDNNPHLYDTIVEKYMDHGSMSTHSSNEGAYQ